VLANPAAAKVIAPVPPEATGIVGSIKFVPSTLLNAIIYAPITLNPVKLE